MCSLIIISHDQTNTEVVYEIKLSSIKSQIKNPIKDTERWLEPLTSHQTKFSYHVEEIQKRFKEKKKEKKI